MGKAALTVSWISKSIFFWLLVGCPNTTTRPDDAPVPSPDVTVITDAGVDARLERPDAFSPDAFSPDGFTLPESCNDVDDDLDGRVDEGGLLCSLAPETHTGDAVCLAGRCLCRPPGTALSFGSHHDDCNANFVDGCETELGTNANCGACGDACDPASDCRFQVGVGFACGPASILDFSIPEPNGEIACIVRADHRLACRGPNADFAISDAAPETAVLGWTFVAMSPASEVRAWQQTRPDGVEALTICVLDPTRDIIECRGNNSAGLLRRGDVLPHRGNHEVGQSPDLVGMSTYADWAIWGGHGFARQSIPSRGAYPMEDWADTRTRVSTLSAIQARIPRVEIADGVTVAQERGAVFRDLEERPLGNVPPALDVACARDVCCSLNWVPAAVGMRPYIGCYGRQIRPDGASTEVSVNDRGRLPMLPNSRFLELAPRADGRIEGCVRVGTTDGSPVLFFCADMTTAADTVGPISPAPFHEEPTRVFGGRTPQARPDWQAMCIQHRPDWWQCWGTHEGWGHE
jgi:hypothetical protein